METDARIDTVLSALLRLARRRIPASREQILLRTGGDAPALRLALRSLEQAGLVERMGIDSARLTMAGFAVAVASAAALRSRARASRAGVVRRLGITKRGTTKRMLRKSAA